MERTDGASGGSAGSAGSGGASAGGTTGGGAGPELGLELQLEAERAEERRAEAPEAQGAARVEALGAVAERLVEAQRATAERAVERRASCGARPGLLFCEDFEDLAVGAVTAVTPWSAEVNGEGTVVIDDAEAHDGARSAKITGNGFSTFLVFHDAALLPAAGKRVYVRAFVRFAEPMSGGAQHGRDRRSC